MSHRRTSFALVLILCTVSLPAGMGTLAAEPVGPASRALDEAADPRLARVEPIALPGVPLAEALRTLTSQTGVRLEAAREVAELMVMLRAEKLPLQRALQEIADVLDLTWTRRGADTGYHYECARSQAATLRAREALEKARATNRAAVQAQLARIAEAFRKGDPAALAATDPDIAAALSDPNSGDSTRTLLGALTQFPAEGLQAMTAMGSLTTTWDRMPPQAQEYVRRETQQSLPMALGNTRGKDGNSIGYDTFLKSASYTMGVNGLDYGGNNFYGEIRVAGMSMRIGVDLGIPSPPSAAPDGGAPAGGTGSDPATGRRGDGATGRPDDGLSPSPRRPLPPMAVRLAGGKRMSVHEIVDWLAEQASFAVVSDYYTTRYERRQVSIPTGATAADALAAMEHGAAVEWSVSPDDRVLRLRSRTWPLDELREPPAAIVAELEKALQAHDQPALSDYLRASQLTDAQGAGLGQIDATKFGVLARAMDGSRPVLKDALRLLGSLPLAERAAAASPAGLSAAQLTPAQRATLGEHLMTMRNDLRPEDLEAALFRIGRQTPGMPGAPALPAPAAAATLETVVFTIEFPGRPPTSTSVMVQAAQATR